MQTFMWHILENAKVYEKLNSEIHSAHSSGLLSEMISYKEAQCHLPYFQACLKEAMRISPAVGLNITRMVPTSGADVGGHTLPGGTRVAVNAWVLHQDREVFGDDAHVYRPERWLFKEGDEAGSEKVKRMDRSMFQFGGGSHVCIGRHLAMLEMNKVLPQLLRRYQFKLVSPGTPLSHHSSFFVVQSGLFVMIKKR